MSIKIIGLDPAQEQAESKINHILKSCSDIHWLATFDNSQYKKNSAWIWMAFKVYCDRYGGDPRKVAFKYIDYVRISKGYVYFERPNMFVHKAFLPTILDSLEKTNYE